MYILTGPFNYTLLQLFLGDELFSDTYPIELIDGAIFRVKGKVSSFHDIIGFQFIVCICTNITDAMCVVIDTF